MAQPVETLVKVNQFESREDCARQLAEDCTRWLQEGINQDGAASLLVSGGRSPVPFFQYLAEQELSWRHVFVSLVDERWVAPDDAASNEALVKEFLIGQLPVSFVGLKNEADSAAQGCQEAQTQIEQVKCPYDVVILGMGEDGHFASLFPFNDHLERSLDLQCKEWLVPSTAPAEPTERISHTLASLLRSRHLILYIQGAKKLDRLQYALDSNAQESPVLALLQANHPNFEVYYAP